MERRSPAVGNSSNNKGGKGETTKAPISLQDLRRSLYVKAKAEIRLAAMAPGMAVSGTRSV